MEWVFPSLFSLFLDTRKYLWLGIFAYSNAPSGGKFTILWISYVLNTPIF